MARARTKIAAAVIAKNDAPALARCLESIRGHIDSATIIDTGSTDATPNVIREHGWEPIKRPWIDFSHNRTEALQLAHQNADYALMLDADMTVEGRIPDNLTADAYMIRVLDNTGFSYRLPLLTRADIPWRYIGCTHEYLTADHPVVYENLDGFAVHHHCDGSRRPEKFQADAALLEQALTVDPRDSRSVFYLAQTHRDLVNIEQAIALYRRRLTLGGWDEELFYAHYQLGRLLCEHVDGWEGAAELLQACRERSHRAEPYRALAAWATSVADELPLPDDILFVHRGDYA